MTDIYLCRVSPAEQIRTFFWLACNSRWRSEGGVTINDVEIHPDVWDSQKKRRVIAEEDAEEDIYVLADDDCLPQAEPFLEEGVRILEEHPEFAILSMMPTNAKINPWRPAPTDYVVHEDDDVMEHVSVGGIRFCRKGCLTEWPPFTGPGYDREHCDALREAGYRVGYFKNLKMLHLGEGYSTVWSTP